MRTRSLRQRYHDEELRRVRALLRAVRACARRLSGETDAVKLIDEFEIQLANRRHRGVP